MKVIFLDMDGVMNSSADWVEHEILGHPNNHGFEMINRGKIAILVALLQATGAKIVWSSTWRHHYTLDQLHAMLEERIGPDSKHRITRDTFIGITPKLGGYEARSREVQSWLHNHGKEVTHFVILDDVDAGFTSNGYRDNFQKTDPQIGMTTLDAYHACVVLEGDEKKMPMVYL